VIGIVRLLYHNLAVAKTGMFPVDRGSIERHIDKGDVASARNFAL
jgi:hypothetical protein